LTSKSSGRSKPEVPGVVPETLAERAGMQNMNCKVLTAVPSAYSDGVRAVAAREENVS
jgi:hypothetical protein